MASVCSHNLCSATHINNVGKFRIMTILLQNPFHSLYKSFKRLIHQPRVFLRIVTVCIADIVNNNAFRYLLTKLFTALTLDFLNNRDHGFRKSFTLAFHRDTILHMHNINGPGAHIHNQIFALHVTKLVCHRRVALWKCKHIFNGKAVLHILITKLHRLLLTLQILHKRLANSREVFQRESYTKHNSGSVWYRTTLTFLCQGCQCQ